LVLYSKSLFAIGGTDNPRGLTAWRSATCGREVGRDHRSPAERAIDPKSIEPNDHKVSLLVLSPDLDDQHRTWVKVDERFERASDAAVHHLIPPVSADDNQVESVFGGELRKCLRWIVTLDHV